MDYVNRVLIPNESQKNPFTTLYNTKLWVCAVFFRGHKTDSTLNLHFQALKWLKGDLLPDVADWYNFIAVPSSYFNILNEFLMFINVMNSLVWVSGFPDILFETAASIH